MLVVVKHAADVAGKDIVLLKDLDDLCVGHEEIQTLDTIQDVDCAVVRILLKVAHL